MVCLSYAYASDSFPIRVPPYERPPTPTPVSTNVRHARQNRRDRTTDDATTAAEEPSTDAQPSETGQEASTDRTGGGRTAAASAGADTSSGAASDPWTRRCQRQFDPGNRDRLTNLVDAENLVVISPGAE